MRSASSTTTTPSAEASSSARGAPDRPDASPRCCGSHRSASGLVGGRPRACVTGRPARFARTGAPRDDRRTADRPEHFGTAAAPSTDIQRGARTTFRPTEPACRVGARRGCPEHRDGPPRGRERRSSCDRPVRRFARRRCRACRLRSGAGGEAVEEAGPEPEQRHAGHVEVHLGTAVGEASPATSPACASWPRRSVRRPLRGPRPIRRSVDRCCDGPPATRRRPRCGGVDAAAFERYLGGRTRSIESNQATVASWPGCGGVSVMGTSCRCRGHYPTGPGINPLWGAAVEPGPPALTGPAGHGGSRRPPPALQGLQRPQRGPRSPPGRRLRPGRRSPGRWARPTGSDRGAAAGHRRAR